MFKLSYLENVSIDLFPENHFLESLFYLETLNDVNSTTETVSLLTYFYAKGIEYYSAIGNDNMCSIFNNKLLSLFPKEEKKENKIICKKNPLDSDLNWRIQFYKIKSKLLISEREDSNLLFLKEVEKSEKSQEEKFLKNKKTKPKKIKFKHIHLDNEEAAEVLSAFTSNTDENSQKELIKNNPLLNPKFDKDTKAFQKVYTNLDSTKLINHCIVDQYEKFINDYVEEMDQIHQEKLNNFLNYHQEQAELSILIENEVVEEQKNELKDMISNGKEDFQLANEEYTQRIKQIREEKMDKDKIIENKTSIENIKEFICNRIEDLLKSIIDEKTE